MKIISKLRRSFLAVVVAATCADSFAATFAEDLIAAARERTTQREIYDGSYRKLKYPMGDVPNDRGVCTDLVIRAYRSLNIDLQVLIHEDMVRDFAAYPTIWNMRQPDRNIDHRRVPNMQTFFTRKGAALPVSNAPQAYRPGDLVTWMLPGNLPHIGIVSDRLVAGTKRPKILHNIGAGPVEDDILFSYRITGHYRYVK